MVVENRPQLELKRWNVKRRESVTADIFSRLRKLEQKS